MEQSFTLLSQLTDDNYRWKVCVRLDKKFPIKTNRKGTMFCTFEFVDIEGTRMPAQAYGDLCTKYHSELREGSFYCFSGCSIEKVRSTRSPGLSQSKFLFIFGDQMLIEEKKADEADILSFPMIHFSTVDEILDLKPGDSVDFVALIKKAVDIIDKKTKAGHILPMREIQVSDESTDDTAILTLWDSFARDFDPKIHKAVVVHGGKIKVYQGKLFVDCTKHTTVKYNPPEYSNNISGFMSLYSRSADAEYDAMNGDELLAIYDKVLADDSHSPKTERKFSQEGVCVAQRKQSPSTTL